MDPRESERLVTLNGKTAIVVGGSRGLGRGIATAFAQAGASVIVVSRTSTTFTEPTTGPGSIRPEIGDASGATMPASLIDRYAPDFLILVAGATPHMRPLRQQSWDTFSVNWEADVRIAFHWLREALLAPLRPSGRVIVVSSGAALQGSPLSGGYAGAKATQRFITKYAQDEASRAGLNITFNAVLPKFSPSTGVGQLAVQAYAARFDQSVDEFLAPLGPFVTPEIAGAAMIELVLADAATTSPEYLLTGAGLEPLR